VEETVMREEPTGWPETDEALATSLTRHGLTVNAVTRIIIASRPALMFAATATPDDLIPIGATKVGGRPDLPPGMVWPVRPAYANAAEMAQEARDQATRLHLDAGLRPPWTTEAEGEALLVEARRQREESRAFMKTLGVEDDVLDTAFDPALFSAELAAGSARTAGAKAGAASGPFPLSFLAQVDLAALANEPGFDPALPRHGRLYLFYDLLLMPASFDPASAPALRVIYDDGGPGALERAALPDALARVADVEMIAFASAAMTPRSVMTTPNDLTVDDPGERGGDDYDEWLSTVAGWPGDGEAGAYQLCGWPREIQSGMAQTAQLAANGVYAGSADALEAAEARLLLAGAGEWRLLFQFGADDEGGGLPAGALNILIREDDLLARRFDCVWAIYEDS
jgi:hypothetical protein